jgi:cell division protein FtsL
MNADPTFAASIVAKADANAARVRLEADRMQHEKAASAIAKNERHVILAYVAMWLVAAGFVIFLWRRQQSLQLEIQRLKHDLDAATRDGKDGK